MNITRGWCFDGRKLAVAVVRRDLEGLRVKVEFEQMLATAGLINRRTQKPYKVR